MDVDVPAHNSRKRAAATPTATLFTSNLKLLKSHHLKDVKIVCSPSAPACPKDRYKCWVGAMIVFTAQNRRFLAYKDFVEACGADLCVLASSLKNATQRLHLSRKCNESRR